MKVLLDEMYSDVIAVELRARGHDPVGVREVIPALAGALVEEVLRTAAAQERTLVSENVRDYRPLETLCSPTAATIMESSTRLIGSFHAATHRPLGAWYLRWTLF